jgi:periplasmic protein TonB
MQRQSYLRAKWLALWIVMVCCCAMAGQESGGNPPARPTPRRKIRVSSGVIQGLVLKKVLPDAIDLKSVKNSEVKVTFEVDEAGAVEGVMKTEGDPMLYDRCIKAIKDWRFKPFVVEGQPIIVESYVYFHFNKGKASVSFYHD